MSTRPIRALVVALLLIAAAPASADKIDTLTRTLMQDPSYKVRVQAALVLGKLADRRAVPALMQALHDENETVRGVAATSLGRIGDRSAANALQVGGDQRQLRVRARPGAASALELVAGGGGGVTAAPPRAGARFYVAIGFNGGGRAAGPEYTRLVREALARELQKVSSVTLSVSGGGEPSRSLLASRHLQGFIVDGSIQRLSATPAGGQQNIDCDLKAFVATFPDRSIKAMTQEGASLQTGSGAVGGRQRQARLPGAPRPRRFKDDVEKFLRTQQ